MSYHFFSIPAVTAKQQETELNQFISQNRILSVEKQFVANGENSFWAICVTTIATEEKFKAGFIKSKRNAVDYKDVLSTDDFRVFAELRKLRKEISESQGIPAYAVFSNEQLAKIVTNQVSNKTELLEIEGVGQARVDKYADSFFEKLSKARPLP